MERKVNEPGFRNADFGVREEHSDRCVKMAAHKKMECQVWEGDAK